MSFKIGDHIRWRNTLQVSVVIDSKDDKYRTRTLSLNSGHPPDQSFEDIWHKLDERNWTLLSSLEKELM